MAIEIVSFPINSMVTFHSCVSLPEGRYVISKHNDVYFMHKNRFREKHDTHLKGYDRAIQRIPRRNNDVHTWI